MSTLVAQTISNGTVSTSTANVINGAKVWVNFNGTTSPGTIRGSYNVSSVTKNGTGDYTVNFTTALTDANYAVTGTIGNAGQAGQVQTDNVAGTFTVNSIRLAVQVSGTRSDNNTVQIAIFR